MAARLPWGLCWFLLLAAPAAAHAQVSPTDSDGDGLPTTWETQLGLDPSSSSGDNGAAGDPDADGETNLEEFQAGTHPRGFAVRSFAEGATTSLFDTRLAILNPRTGPANILLRFLKGDGSTVSHITCGSTD